MKKKSLLLSLDQDMYNFIKETAKTEEWTILRMIRELLSLGISSYKRRRKKSRY